MLGRLRITVAALLALLISCNNSFATDFSAAGIGLGMTYNEVKSKLGTSVQNRDVVVSNIPARILISSDPAAKKVYSFYFLKDRVVWIFYSQNFDPGKGPNAESMLDAAKAKYGDETTFGGFTNGIGTYVYDHDGKLLSNDPSSVNIVSQCWNAMTNTMPAPSTNAVILFPTTWRAACNKTVRFEIFSIEGIVRSYQVKIIDEAPGAAYMIEQAEAKDRARQNAAETARGVKPEL